ncbi:hypothetical protein M1731_18135, partial [Salmonella enterica subsp. enterica serovar Javiana]|uniref:hypothetical protein n=1 Tax=Salmonella enterica TaxID=28901 RepID=UPI0021B37384
FKVAYVLATDLLGPSMGLALTGRRTRRSNLRPADLSLIPVTLCSWGLTLLPPLSTRIILGRAVLLFYRVGYTVQI